MSVEIVAATERHARAMAPHLRPGDLAEIAAGGMDALGALLDGVRRSLWARAALVDGVPAAMWGVTAASFFAPAAHPWLLTTELVERHKKRFLRECRAQVAEMRAVAPVLSNLVDGRYAGACRLLRWLGFEIAEHDALPHLRPFRMEG